MNGPDANELRSAITILADCLADHGERLLADLAIGHNEIWVAHIDFVDLGFWDKLVDLDGALALDRDGFQLLRVELDVFALVDLEAFDDVGLFDLVTRFGIHLAIPNAVTGLFVELMKTDLFALACRGIKRDRAGDERQLQIAFPIRTRGHGTHLYATQIRNTKLLRFKIVPMAKGSSVQAGNVG